MFKEKLLSIVIPSYNSELFIDECLLSIVEQQNLDFDEIEVVFVDDGSTDKTKNIIAKYEKYSFMRFFAKENTGISLTRNFGVEHSVGKYILFLDSDDKIDLNGLSIITKVISELCADIVFFSGDVFFDENLSENSFRPTYKRPNIVCDKIISGRRFFIDSIKKEAFFVQPCMYIFKRELFDNNEFVPGVLHEDNPFTVNLILHKSINVFCLQDRIYKRRIRNNSVMTSTFTTQNAEGYLFSVRYIFDNYFKNNHDKELKLSIKKLMFKLIKCGLNISLSIGSESYVREFNNFYLQLNPSLLERIKFKRPIYYRLYKRLIKA